MKARSMVTTRRVAARRSIWDRIWDDLGRPPAPLRSEFAVAVLVLVVLMFAMSLDYPV